MPDDIEIEPPLEQQEIPSLKKVGTFVPDGTVGWVSDENGFYDPAMVDPNDIDPAKR